MPGYGFRWVGIDDPRGDPRTEASHRPVGVLCRECVPVAVCNRESQLYVGPKSSVPVLDKPAKSVRYDDVDKVLLKLREPIHRRQMALGQGITQGSADLHLKVGRQFKEPVYVDRTLMRQT